MKKTILFGFITFGLLTACKKEEVKPTTSTESTPKVEYNNFKVTSIQVNKIPMVDESGSSWDTFDGPDLKFNIEDLNSKVLYDGTSSRFEDLVLSSFPIKWSFTSPYQITNFDLNYFITLYDYDYPDDDDNIGYVGINFNQYKTDYPTTITKSSLDGSINLTIKGNWY